MNRGPLSGHATDEVFNRYSIDADQRQRAAFGTVSLYTHRS